MTKGLRHKRKGQRVITFSDGLFKHRSYEGLQLSECESLGISLTLDFVVKYLVCIRPRIRVHQIVFIQLCEEDPIRVVCVWKLA